MGLAADFCVMDTAINANLGSGIQGLKTYIIYDQTRYAWFPPALKNEGKGHDFNEGRFITPTSEVLKKYDMNNIGLIHSKHLKPARI
jgi:hypothetical protein